MKKILFFVFLLSFIAVALFSYTKLHVPGFPLKTSTVSDKVPAPLVTIAIFDGEKTATYPAIPARTVFEGLRYLESNGTTKIKTKQYDFGIFVEEIGDKQNTEDHAWLYFVNGVSGDVASDKKEVKEGDLIEWRYMKPTF